MENNNLQCDKIYNSLVSSCQQISMCIEKTIDIDATKAIAKSMSDTMKSYQKTYLSLIESVDWESLTNISTRLMPLVESINSEVLNNISHNLTLLKETVASCYSSEYFEDLSEQVSRSTNYLYDTWDKVEPMIAGETGAILHLNENPVLQKVKEKAPLSLSDKLGVLSLLISIFSLLLGFFPDSQLEKLQQQNEEIISNQHQSISINERNNQELEKSLHMLQDTIEALHQEIQSFRE